MQATPDISFKRKALLLASAWLATALTMTILAPHSWSYFWLFAYCSPITWVLSFLQKNMVDNVSIYSLVVVGWLYYIALAIATLLSKRRFWFYILYAAILISLASNVEGCREWSQAKFS